MKLDWKKTSEAVLQIIKNFIVKYVLVVEIFTILSRSSHTVFTMVLVYPCCRLLLLLRIISPTALESSSHSHTSRAWRSIGLSRTCSLSKTLCSIHYGWTT